MIEDGLQKDLLLSTNIPYLPLDEIKGIKITKQGERVYLDELVSQIDPFGRPYYWIGGEHPTGKIIPDTDFGAINDGYVSITPLKMDMTAYEEIKRLKTWDW